MLRLEDLGGKKGWVLDMDDTIANFHAEKNALEKFATKNGFFKELKPTKLLLAIQIAIVNKVIDIDQVYVVSASPNDQADKDKQAWLDQWFNVPQENRTFVRLGECKARAFQEKYGVSKIDLANYVLIDDYTKNILEWIDFGGVGVKCINDYNNTRQHYTQHNIETINYN